MFSIVRKLAHVHAPCPNVCSHRLHLATATISARSVAADLEPITAFTYQEDSGVPDYR